MSGYYFDEEKGNIYASVYVSAHIFVGNATSAASTHSKESVILNIV